MVTITSFALSPNRLEDTVEQLGGEVTHTETWRDNYKGEYRPVSWEIEVYFDEEDHNGELEEELLELVDGTGWRLGFNWDMENGGVLFENHLRD